MSDTCIVCLGDLGESASIDHPLLPVPTPGIDDVTKTDGTSGCDRNDDDDDGDGRSSNEDAGQIAQLLPCGHILHNNCLKPWVERANSCPICRQSFNVVQLSEQPGGMFCSFIVIVLWVTMVMC